jgi:hypothetical protein
MSKEQPHHTVEVSSGDQHRIDTPPEQHDALRVDETDTRTFFEKLCAHATVAAAGLDRPGYLNLSGLRPSSKNLRLIGRFKPEDIDGLTAAAVAEAALAATLSIQCPRSLL